MLNQIAIHGRLTADPEKRYTKNDVSVCSFTVAVDRNYKNGDEKQTDFFQCKAWRVLADTVSKYFSKGKEIIVYGSMLSDKWKDDDGNNRISWYILASGVDFCGKKDDSIKESSGKKDEYDGFHEFNDDDEEIPF